VLLVGIVGVIILVGIVGAIRASGGGSGILNAFTAGGSSGAQSQVVSQAVKTALQQTRLHPNDPAGWAALVQARWTEAGQGNDYNTSTGTFTAAGKKELTGATQAWERYLQLTKQPDPNLAILAARAYAAGGNYSGEASAWEIETLANPNEAKGYECLAASAYAAKQTRKGDLATAKALSLVPKLSRATLKTQLEQARRSLQSPKGAERLHGAAAQVRSPA
jgi:predicted Zn-dependent protease